jgi:hypothetical protein
MEAATGFEDWLNTSFVGKAGNEPANIQPQLNCYTAPLKIKAPEH